MSLATSNRDGGRTSESGHLRPLLKGLAGEILTGLAVSQRGAGANMSVDIAIGDAMIPRSDGTYGHPAWNDAVYNQVIAVADVSNPRRDIIVMYIDYGQTPSTGVSNNTNGVVKIKSVAGTPAGSPVDPTDSAIQSSVGAGNPFVKLARVRVAAAATTITNSVIDDMRAMAQALDNGGWQPQSTAWDAWTYSSWDATRKYGVITVADSSIYKVGQKVRVWQLTGGWKYGWLFALPTATTIGVYFGNNYTLQNERIYLPAISRDSDPDGFTKDPAAWRLQMMLTATAAIAGAGTWVNPGSLLVACSPGLWHVTAMAKWQINNGNAECKFALSRANNSVTDAEVVTRDYNAATPTRLSSSNFTRDYYSTTNVTFYLVANSTGAYDMRGDTTTPQQAYIEVLPMGLI